MIENYEDYITYVDFFDVQRAIGGLACRTRGRLYDGSVWVGDALRAISNIKKADVKPAKHGKWILKDHDGSWEVCACSVCKKWTHFVNYTEAYNFCPNCGADMRKVETWF